MGGTTILEPREEEGGGVNPSIQPGWEYELNGYWDDDFTNALDHLSAEAGGITSKYVKLVWILGENCPWKYDCGWS